MAESTETLKRQKKHKLKKREHVKQGGPTALRITLAIGRINKALRTRQEKTTAEDARVERMLQEALRDTTLGLHYVWGGGHGESPTHAFDSAHSTGGDCSSYASHLCQVAVPKVKTGTTFTLASSAGSKGSGLKKGPGKFVTLHIKNSPANDAHVIVEIHFKGRVYWTQCGGRDNTKGGGPCIFKPTADRIAEFPTKVHPNGL